MPEDKPVSAIKLVARFQRCKNYPKDETELVRMAGTLERASRDFHVSMEKIVTEALDTSEWCPTDADLRTIAQSVRGPEKAPELKSQPGSYGPRFNPSELARIMENGKRAETERKEQYRRIKEKLGVSGCANINGLDMAWARRELGYQQLPEAPNIPEDYRPGMQEGVPADSEERLLAIVGGKSLQGRKRTTNGLAQPDWARAAAGDKD